MSEDHIHNAVNVVSFSFTLIYRLQMSLEIRKLGQSPTKTDRSKTKEITFHRLNHGPNPHKQQVVLAPLLDSIPGFGIANLQSLCIYNHNTICVAAFWVSKQVCFFATQSIQIFIIIYCIVIIVINAKARLLSLTMPRKMPLTYKCPRLIPLQCLFGPTTFIKGKCI